MDPLNFEEIINAINNLMEDSDLYTNLSNNGNIALVKNFNWSTQESKLFKLFQSL